MRLGIFHIKRDTTELNARQDLAYVHITRRGFDLTARFQGQ